MPGQRLARMHDFVRDRLETIPAHILFPRRTVDANHLLVRIPPGRHPRCTLWAFHTQEKLFLDPEHARDDLRFPVGLVNVSSPVSYCGLDLRAQPGLGRTDLLLRPTREVVRRWISHNGFLLDRRIFGLGTRNHGRTTVEATRRSSVS